MAGKTKPTQSGEKVLQVLDTLLRNFAHGFSSSELSKATGFSMSNITIYVATLEARGFAERITETGRIRASHRMAQHAVAIMRSLQTEEDRARESINRITKDI